MVSLRQLLEMVGLAINDHRCPVCNTWHIQRTASGLCVSCDELLAGVETFALIDRCPGCGWPLTELDKDCGGLCVECYAVYSEEYVEDFPDAGSALGAGGSASETDLGF